METFTIERTALPELTFSGQLLAESIGEDTNGQSQGRVHELRVYETDDHQYIVSCRFRSPFESELSDSFVEVVDTIDEVEATLSLYDATERIDAAAFANGDAGRKQGVCTVLRERFDRLVLQVLDVLNAREPV